MTNLSTDFITNTIRSDWIKLRTLIMLRWLAVAGQIIAVIVAHYGIGLQINIGLCAVAIGASVIFNIIATFILPANKRLTERSATLSLLFDLIQLVVLLYLTGGLTNPFALLLLAPITISATALTLRTTIFLGVFAIAAITLLAPYHQPLITSDGEMIELPNLLLWGNWSALVIGSIFLASYARRVTDESFSMSKALAATQMALDREHKLTLLGGVVAAAAHEMGTPLATIKMVATELEEELSDKKELQEDARLVREQADRLSQILRDMGRTGKDDLHVKQAPLIVVLHEAAEPHEARGKEIIFLINGKHESEVDDFSQSFPRKPEIIHGLRNLIQNAVDFAHSTVWINAVYTDTSINIFVADDGKGFPFEFLSRIGDPFLRRNKVTKTPDRPEYEGMGLGLFIAKTMLERTGASLSFTNNSLNGAQTEMHTENMKDATGALVSVTWPISAGKSNVTISAKNPDFQI
jgi:two-component system sensor histidine kinase RegB